ncbi:hypothetical protein L596_006106 [Steinernema carpocapsae]|uniref:Uncharacterized protein n=1 Tax=Steinernema carpocapsae TaxID=34508 RepID=A0A4U8V898_STECR|nr:hypothetical protein L596_006106 [Steinernema carpocapsae]
MAIFGKILKLLYLGLLQLSFFSQLLLFNLTELNSPTALFHMHKKFSQLATHTQKIAAKVVVKRIDEMDAGRIDYQLRGFLCSALAFEAHFSISSC